MKKEDHPKLEERIRKALKHKLMGYEMTAKTMEELVEEISIYHQELEYQNVELMRTQQEVLQEKEKLIVSLEDFKHLYKEYATLFEEAPTPYLVMDQDHQIRQANEQCRDLMGLNEKKINGRAFEQFVAKESQDQVFHYFRKVTSGLVPDPITISMEFPGGFRSIRLEANRVPMRQTFHVRIALTDQTKEVARAQGLEHQIRMLAAVVEHSDSIVVVKDLNCRVIATNTAFARAAGYEKPSELIGKTDAEIFGVSPDTEPIRSYMEDERKAMTLSPGDMLIREEPVVTPSGEVRTVLTKKFPVYDDEGKVQGSGSISPDITTLKNIQLELEEKTLLLEKKNQELDDAVHLAEMANEAKSRYLAHMNHEIRTPLNGFIGFLQLMESTTLNSEQQEYLEYMQQSSRHLLSIINNVLDMATIEAGEIQLSKRPFVLEKEIQSAVSALYPLVEQKGNQLQLILDKNLPHRVVGDPDRLRQIILNLAGNAVKFTEKGMVNVTLRSLENKEETHTLQLQVQDTGPGMTRESLNRLFQPFYQVDDGSGPHPGGTGLGMTITRELVEKMGGSIQVESVLGEGTKAVVHLPLKESI